MTTPTTAPVEEKVCPLSPTEWRPFKLKEVIQEQHDVKRFRFELEEGQSLNFPSTAVMKLRIQHDGRWIGRSQTPITTNDVTGYFDLVIKIYPWGKLGQYMDKMNPGDTMEMRGPSKKIQYPFGYKHIGMVAAGSGITPMLQSVYEVLRHPEDKTKMSLIFANNTPRDIIMKKEIDRLVSENPDQLKVHYVVLEPEDGWSEEDGSVGYITKDMIEEHLFPFTGQKASELSHLTDSHCAFVCGPIPFYNIMCGPGRNTSSEIYRAGPAGRKLDKGYFKDLGFSPMNVYKF